MAETLAVIATTERDFCHVFSHFGLVLCGPWTPFAGVMKILLMGQLQSTREVAHQLNQRNELIFKYVTKSYNFSDLFVVSIPNTTEKSAVPKCLRYSPF